MLIGDLTHQLTKKFKSDVERLMDDTRISYRQFYVLMLCFIDKSNNPLNLQEKAGKPRLGDLIERDGDKYAFIPAGKQVIRVRYKISENCPPVRQFGTICCFLDRDKGTAKMLWCLPKDVAVPNSILVDQLSQAALKSVENLPIVN